MEIKKQYLYDHNNKKWIEYNGFPTMLTIIKYFSTELEAYCFLIRLNKINRN